MVPTEWISVWSFVQWYSIAGLTVGAVVYVAALTTGVLRWFKWW